MNFPITQHIFVFINNKLITTDTVLPLLFELRVYNPNFKATFVTHDKKTFNDLKKNIVIFNAIKTLGNLKYFNFRNKNKFLNIFEKIKLVFFIFKIAILSLRNKATVIHFKLLNYWPWRILSIFNKKRIFFFDNAFHTFLEFDVSNINQRRQHTKFLDQAPIANAVVTFNKDCNLVIDKKVEKIEKIITNPTHNMKAWLEYIENNSKAYLNEILKNPISLDNNNISLMLGTLDTPITYLENKDSVKECLVDVLNTLRKIKKKMKIFVKPHVISNPQIFNEILSKYEDLPIILNYLHPAVLANYSKISICNYWSYSQPHAMAQGAFVIEYTQYSKEALNLTNGQSYMPQYVDYFINKDQEKLENKINLCLSKKKNPKSIGSANLSLLKRIYGN